MSLLIIKPGDVIELRTKRHLRFDIDENGIKEVISIARVGEKLIVLSEINRNTEINYLKVLHENKVGYIIWDFELPFFKIEIV